MNKLQDLVKTNDCTGDVMNVFLGKLKMIETAFEAGKTDSYKVNALKKVKDALALLETDLGTAKEDVTGIGSRDQPKLKGALPYYLVGDNVSIADLSWACVLFQLILLGNESLWENSPRIQAYVKKLFDLPSIQETVIFWCDEGRMVAPSPYTAQLYIDHRPNDEHFKEHREIISQLAEI